MSTSKGLSLRNVQSGRHMFEGDKRENAIKIVEWEAELVEFHNYEDPFNPSIYPSPISAAPELEIFGTKDLTFAYPTEIFETHHILVHNSLLELRRYTFVNAGLKSKPLGETIQGFYRIVFDLGGQEFEFGTICFQEEMFDVILDLFEVPQNRGMMLGLTLTFLEGSKDLWFQNWALIMNKVKFGFFFWLGGCWICDTRQGGLIPR